MNTNSDDILLLKLIKQGDQIAFRHLFYQYADSLERFITYYIHDREKSQDLVLDIRLDPSLPTDQAYTFTITHESLEEVLCLIAKITPIEYVFDEDNTVRITRK